MLQGTLIICLEDKTEYKCHDREVALLHVILIPGLVRKLILKYAA